MRKIMITAMAALIAATSFSTLGVAAAEAQPRHWRGTDWSEPSGQRHNYNGPRYSGPRHGYGQRYYGPRYHHRGPNWGAVAAGSVLGLAAGAAIAGSARSNDAVAYCQQRFKSYDVRSGTYLGYDGRRHACP
jgi:hypothetical protein